MHLFHELSVLKKLISLSIMSQIHGKALDFAEIRAIEALPRPNFDGTTPLRSADNFSSDVNSVTAAVPGVVPPLSRSLSDISNNVSRGACISSESSQPSWRFKKVIQPRVFGFREIYVRCGFRTSPAHLPNDVSGLVHTLSQVSLNRQEADDNAVVPNGGGGEAQGLARDNSSQPRSDAAEPSRSESDIGASANSASAAVPGDVTPSSGSVGAVSSSDSRGTCITPNLSRSSLQFMKVVRPGGRKMYVRCGRRPSLNDLIGASQTQLDASNPSRSDNIIKADVPSSNPSGSAVFPSSNVSSRDFRGLCIICMELDVKTVFLPCRHAICCAGCAKEVDLCPLCRSAISVKLDVYFS